jgi:hypothetical protein
MKTKTSEHQNQTHQNQVTTLVERGYTILLDLIVLNEEFNKIKERLKEEAAARPNEHVPLLEKNSEGSQWIAYGAGSECRIVFPDAKLKTDFNPLESDFLAIRSLAGDHFKSLFRKVTLYRPADRKTFRSLVKDRLAAKTATKLLDLCTSASEAKIQWKARPIREEQE